MTLELTKNICIDDFLTDYSLSNTIFIEDGAMKEEGKYIPHFGGVFIGKGTKFQNFVSIKRAINEKEYTKIGHDNYISSFVNIGHNARIGDDNFIASHVAIQGFTTIGDHCYIGSGVRICPKVKIGDWVKISANSVISKDIPSHSYVTKNGSIKKNKCSPLYEDSMSSVQGN